MEVVKETTAILDWLDSTDKRVNLIFGGAGSSKSYSTAQWIIKKAYSEKNKRILITRKTLPSLRITAYKLILDLLQEYRLPFDLNKSELTIMLPNRTELLFKSLDEPEKVKSAEFNYIWVEEATETTLDDFMQLNLRLRRQNDVPNQMYLTFNPISKLHWIYRELIEKQRDDIAVHRSTYKDNPFLSGEYVRQLEDLINQDQNYYKIYCLGEWGVLSNIIYTNYESIDGIPNNPDETIYGLDFGFNNPSVLLQISIKDQQPYIKELLYESKLTNQDLITRLDNIIGKGKLIYADGAEPARIEEICKAGYICMPADKEVKDGIDYVKRHHLMITKDSINTLKEISGYKYREDKDKHVLEEPVKFNDHAMDALRYALYTHEKQAVSTEMFRLG